MGLHAVYTRCSNHSLMELGCRGLMGLSEQMLKMSGLYSKASSVNQPQNVSLSACKPYSMSIQISSWSLSAGV